MDNNQDKNVFQVPATQSSESLSAPETLVDEGMSQAEVDRNFAKIAREYVSETYNQMTQDLEMSLSGYETRQVAPVEIASPHPVAVELLQIGAELKARRAKYHESLVEAGLVARFLGKIIAKDPASIAQPSIEKIIEHESKIGAKLFPVDPDVTEMKYFFLPDETGDKWYHSQVSQVRHKHFTNSYAIQEYGIDKSSTFFAEHHGRFVNVSLPTSDEEAQNLLIASKKYYTEVTGKVYVKKPAPRLRFRSKDDHDLAA